MPWWTLAVAWSADVGAIEELDLEQLLDLEYDVASRMELPAREAPGIVTVLSRDELVSAGATDLLDALTLLPSMAPAVDVWGTVGLGVRGNWAFDGKMLVMVDGVVVNELLYGTYALGHRIPVWAIERIEVIRGPGSALYGGGAGLAVVEVTTVAGSDTDGFGGHLSGSLFDSGALHEANASVGGATPLGDDGRLGLLLTGGFGARSDGTYVDVYGQTAPMNGASFGLDPGLASVDLQLGGLDAQLVAESYRLTFQDGYDARPATPKRGDYHSVQGRVSYRQALGERVTLSPRLEASHQLPWSNLSVPPSSRAWYMDSTVDRVTGGVDLDASVSDEVELYVGAEGGVDAAHVHDMVGWDYATGPSIAYGRAAVIGQAIARLPLATLTAGSRADYHQAYGWALSPRLAVTRTFEVAHVKLLGSRAFRAPTVEHLRLPVDPEFTWTVEAEVGVRPVPHTYVTLSGWDVTLVDPLYYAYDLPEVGEGYENGSPSGTRGVEAEARWQYGGGHLVLAFTSWTATRTPPVQVMVPGHPRRHAGLPQHEVVLRGGAPIGPLRLGGSARWLSARSTTTTSDGVTVSFDDLPPALVVGAVVSLPDVLAPGVDVQLQAHDLLDASPGFAAPYDSWHAPLPSSGRTVGLTVAVNR